MKVELQYENEKVELILQSSGYGRHKCYRVGWRPAGTEKNFSFPRGFSQDDGTIKFLNSRKKNWTGFKRAMREFESMRKASYKLNFKTSN
jgi:hypothetical protein